MGIGLGLGLSIGLQPKNWAAYWAGLVSATVENAAPTKIVMTFGVANTTLVAADFTVAGFTVTLLERDATNKILTLTVSVAVVYGDSLTITFVKTGGTKAVTNNVLYAMLLTSTGNGTGVSTLTLTVSADMLVTLGANAKFYSDASGTADESATFTFLSGAARTRYIKCTTGTATMTFADVKKVISFGNITVTGWVSGANAASLGGDVSKWIGLTFLRVGGSNTLSGNVALFVNNITRIAVLGNTTLGGDISALTSLDMIFIEGFNTLTGLISTLTSLTYINLIGLNTVSGDLNPIVSDLAECLITGNNRMVDYTAGATWGNTRVTINPAAGYGYDSTEIDNMLIDMAASVALISKTITLQGSSAARTAASNAAVATLEGVGRTCTVVTN